MSYDKNMPGAVRVSAVAVCLVQFRKIICKSWGREQYLSCATCGFGKPAAGSR
ncbi:hypothetical protein [Pontibacter rugosus]